MRSEPAPIVESIHAYGVREINALEERIVASDDDVDAMLWEQAGRVVERLAAGLTQLDLAEQWVNPRTGAFYSQPHVSYTKQVYKLADKDPRPRFRDAYNAIAHPTRTKSTTSKVCKTLVEDDDDCDGPLLEDVIQPIFLTMSAFAKETKATPAAQWIERARQNYAKGIGLDATVIEELERLRDWFNEAIVGLDPFIVTCGVKQEREK